MRPNLKERPCKWCKTPYTPRTGLQSVCGITCALAQSKAKSAAVAQKEADRRHREQKLALKPRAKWLQEAQVAFNSYIRARDAGKPCISSGVSEKERFTGGYFDAGHYRSTGAAAHLRFNTWNCHGQAKRENRELSGNVVAYRLGLIERIGLERVERLEHDQELRSFDIVYLRRVKSIFSKRARHITRLRGIT